MDDRLVSELLRLATELAERASAIHRSRLGGGLSIETKSSRSDLVSDVDREVEREIAERLLAERPGDGLLAEEGSLQEGTSGVRWIVDPLDGTTNFVRGYPFFGCSIAVEVEGHAVVGVVSHSLLDVVFTGAEGRDARRGGRPITMGRPPTSLSEAIVSTGFSYDSAQRRLQAAAATQMLGRLADVRRSGSAALDLCHVAMGAVDAFFELDLSPWDYAAGSVIVRAAGGEVLQLPAAHGKGPAIVAAHPRLLPALVELLKKAGTLTA